MSEQVDFLSRIVSPEQLARVQKPAKPVAPPRREGEKVLEYGDSRPEVSRTYIADGPMPSRERMERDPPSGGAPDAAIDSSAMRPETCVDPVAEMRKRNSMTLDEMRRDYVEQLTRFHNHERPDRPFFAPQAAVDFSEQLRKHGPAAAAVPAGEYVATGERRM